MQEGFMKRIRSVYFIGGIGLVIGLAVLVAILPGPGQTQEEVAPSIARYRERVRTGYYEGYEAKPRYKERGLLKIGYYEKYELPLRSKKRDPLKAPGILQGTISYSSAGAEVRIRTRLPDVHVGLKFYEQYTCIECHMHQARNVHTDRGGNTCRQCHGPEPIPAINHYYSPMNPIRRHAYVCAKCHEGANDLFATYVNHEPDALSLETLESFPSFFYANWFMILLLVGTMAFFLPHSLMALLQELAMKKGKTGIDILTLFVPRRFTMFLQALFRKR